MPVVHTAKHTDAITRRRFTAARQLKGCSATLFPTSDPAVANARADPLTRRASADGLRRAPCPAARQA
jgi:hypothetical protein